MITTTSMVTFSIYGFIQFLFFYTLAITMTTAIWTLVWRNKREQNKKRKEAARVGVLEQKAHV